MASGSYNHLLTVSPDRRAPMSLDVPTLVISVAALGSSIWSAVTAARIGREQNQLQARFLEFEVARERERLAATQRAALTAEMHRGERSGTLTITNGGQASARNIEICLDGVPISAHHLTRYDQKPITVLAPGASVDYPVMTYDGMPWSYTVALSWMDNSGQEGRWESQLTLRR